MALTRPRLGQLITNVVNLTDSMTVINSAATQANVDVGFIFNRADGVNSVANVALYWNESLQSFTFASTNDSGANTANINPISWANITAGNITANGFYWPNGASYGASIIAAQSVYSNANVAAYLVTNTGNLQAGNITTVGISGNISNVSYILANTGIYSGNVQANSIIVGTGLYFSNGTPFSTGTASVSGLNGQLQYNNNGVLAGANISFFSSNVSLVSTANITTTGNIVGGGVRSTTSATPPANPVPGDVWYNSTTDAIYRYTQDSTSSYWLNVFAPSVTSNSSIITTTTNSNANVASYVTVAGGGFPGGVYYIPYGNIGNYTGNTQLGSSTNFFYNSSSGILAAPTGAFNQINAQVSPFNLIPTTISQMNFGNASTTIFMGAASGTVQMAGNLTLLAGSGYFAGVFNENDTRSGVFVGNTGSGTPTPRIGFFNGNTTQNWEIDNYNGQFRWFTPGVTRMNLDGNTNQLTVYGNVSSTANVIASNAIISGNAVVSGLGGVSQPNIPAFRVIGSGGTPIAATANVTSSNFTVDFNQGGYLNTTTGFFTAPIAGLYQVCLVTRTSSNTNSGILQAVVQQNYNGGNKNVIMIEYGTNTSMNHTGGSTIVKMAVGDSLQFRVLSGSINFDGNDNWSVAFLG